MSNPVLAAPANAMSAPMSEQDAIWSRITWRIVPIVLEPDAIAAIAGCNVDFCLVNKFHGCCSFTKTGAAN